MIFFNLELIIKFFLRCKFQENIITVALGTYPQAMRMKIGGIKTMWFINIFHMMWTGICRFDRELVIEVDCKRFTLFYTNLRTHQQVIDIITGFLFIKQTGFG